VIARGRRAGAEDIVTVFRRVQSLNSNIASLVERAAGRFEVMCREQGSSCSGARFLVMWGGGKDSTIALIFTVAMSELTGSRVSATTMVHPGLTPGTFANIERIRTGLDLTHEWRQFLRTPTHPFQSDFADWNLIYRRLALATRLHPRFMCIACNLGAIVAECQAINETQAEFSVTGNPLREFARFDEWAASLRQRLSGIVDFVDPTGRTLLDYYRFWWSIYDALLTELSGVVEPGRPGTTNRLLNEEYLYAFPGADQPVARAARFGVIDDELVQYLPGNHVEILKGFGWRLPEDIQAGTESDCAMPSAIAAIDIARDGLPRHLVRLREVVDQLTPLPEMYTRAQEWLFSGRSVTQGRALLNAMGVDIDWPGKSAALPNAPIAQALAAHLLPVR
jgi:hypothetical protein